MSLASMLAKATFQRVGMVGTARGVLAKAEEAEAASYKIYRKAFVQDASEAGATYCDHHDATNAARTSLAEAIETKRALGKGRFSGV